MIKKKPFLYELCCTIDDDRRGQTEILRDFLVGYDVRAQDIVSFERGGLFRVCVYFNDKYKAKKMQRRVNQHLAPQLHFKIKKIKNENWKTKFAKNFSIFALTKKFDVVPSWKRKKYRKTPRTPIIIDSINAFGTGLHETTSFMAQLIERMEGKFNTFLDIGTGTGLLVMIALKCGAQDVRAIDFDPDAVVAAKQNLRINNYPDHLVRRGDIENYNAKKRFDFVAANLITRDLIKFKKQIISTVKKGGFLAISGIMIENVALIRKAFNIKKLRCVKMHKGEQWVAFLYRRVA
ncbi:MAG: 50S ribosomal protein L11 methyltransferase [Candidatus Omnitrophica bacterium]|nr:50S ribosomal protein L11 methyltransferase [Candidatus Omnitrophota bacterium]